ncbi:MAG: YajQ family cyclic di-GMP-binding protein [Pseudomonadota bacterium]
MPSFDIVSELDQHELTNAVDQANREVTNRFDFRDSGAKYKLTEKQIEMVAQSDFQIKQMEDVLRNKFAKRDIDVRFLDFQAITTNLNEAKQIVVIKQGLEKEQAKKLIKLVKDSKEKVQANIQGEQVRVTGKSRDALQTIISFLKKAEFSRPLQFVNFRD